MKHKARVIICMMTVIVVAFGSIVFVNAKTSVDKMKKEYLIYDYRSGDCLVSSNTYMLKRKAILLGDTAAVDLQNNTSPNKLNGGSGSVRRVACYDTDGYFNDVRSEYSFTYHGRKYVVKSASLNGSATQKTKTIKKLLASHPEGIVVWGQNSCQYGPHAVLAAYVTKNDNIMYIDSAHNTASNSKKYGGHNSSMNHGLETIGKTIITRGVGSFTRYYYISKVK